jgi:ribosomal-protein-alanine N-acetyltransferase
MIRNYEKRDLDMLYRLDQVCFPATIAYSRAELNYFLTHPNCACWIFEPAGGPLHGFLILERTRRRGRLMGHIVTLDVDPRHRRRGAGKLLMQAAEEHMRQESGAAITLEVAVNNPDAQQFYRSQGFAVIGKIEKYYGGKVDAEVMEKPLWRMEESNGGGPILNS